MKRFLPLYWAFIAIPLEDPKFWVHMDFGDVPKNTIIHDKSGLTMKVDNSASPLFFKLGKTMEIHSIEAKGTLSGVPKIPKDKTQGEDDADDYALRIGIVLEGEDYFSWVEKLFAPGWVKDIIDIDPKREFKGVKFLVLAQEEKIAKKWEHPKLGFVEEEIAMIMPKAGAFSFKHKFKKPVRSFALWLQSDGDDTQSSYSVKISKLFIEVPYKSDPLPPQPDLSSLKEKGS